MKRDLKDYLEDILKALNSIDKFTKGFNFNSFVEDEKTNFAVIHAIQIIGEATNKIPTEIQNDYLK
jgi:uncharacterized protein with HEPN domain